MGNVLASILKVALIIALIYVLFLFFYKFYSTYGLSVSRTREEAPSLRQTERVKKLPKDLLATIRRHWDARQYRDALALLYNGAVAYVDGRFSCAIRDSDTEGDCLRKTRNVDVQVRIVFVEITKLWRNLAYGGALPSDEEFRNALNRFGQDIAE